MEALTAGAVAAGIVAAVYILQSTGEIPLGTFLGPGLRWLLRGAAGGLIVTLMTIAFQFQRRNDDDGTA